jgi:hypothetical protein
MPSAHVRVPHGNDVRRQALRSGRNGTQTGPAPRPRTTHSTASGSRSGGRRGRAPSNITLSWGSSAGKGSLPHVQVYRPDGPLPAPPRPPTTGCTRVRSVRRGAWGGSAGGRSLPAHRGTRFSTAPGCAWSETRTQRKAAGRITSMRSCPSGAPASGVVCDWSPMAALVPDVERSVMCQPRRATSELHSAAASDRTEPGQWASEWDSPEAGFIGAPCCQSSNGIRPELCHPEPRAVVVGRHPGACTRRYAHERTPCPLQTIGRRGSLAWSAGGSEPAERLPASHSPNWSATRGSSRRRSPVWNAASRTSRCTTCIGWPVCSEWTCASCSRRTRSPESEGASRQCLVVSAPGRASRPAAQTADQSGRLVGLEKIGLPGFRRRGSQPSTQAHGEARSTCREGGGGRRRGACCLSVRVGTGDTVARPDRLRGVRAVVGARRQATENRSAVAGAPATGTHRRRRHGSARHRGRWPARSPSVRRAAFSNASVPALEGRGASVGRRHRHGRRAQTRAA